MGALGEAPAQHQVAVQDTPYRVGDRLVEIITFHQDRVETGYAPLLGGAASFEKLRQSREDRRGVAPRGRRLPGGKADLALSPGEARHRVEEEHDVLALIAEVLRNSSRNVGTAQTSQRRSVRRGNDDDRALEPLRSQIVLNELAHLSGALTNEGNHIHVGFGVAGDHADQR